MIPGRSSSTCTPSPASRTAQSCEVIASPAFEMQYSPRLTDAVSAEMDVTKMILNPPGSAGAWRFASQWFATACVRKYGPWRLVRRTSSNDASLVSVRSARTLGAMPALLTSASSRPKASSVCARIAARSSRRPTSPRTGTNAWPGPAAARLHSSTVSSAAAALLAKLIATESPCAAASMAMPRPSPRLAPVTRTTGTGFIGGSSGVGRIIASPARAPWSSCSTWPACSALPTPAALRSPRSPGTPR